MSTFCLSNFLLILLVNLTACQDDQQPLVKPRFFKYKKTDSPVVDQTRTELTTEFTQSTEPAPVNFPSDQNFNAADGSNDTLSGRSKDSPLEENQARNESISDPGAFVAQNSPRTADQALVPNETVVTVGSVDGGLFPTNDTFPFGDLDPQFDVPFPLDSGNKNNATATPWSSGLTTQSPNKTANLDSPIEQSRRRFLSLIASKVLIVNKKEEREKKNPNGGKYVKTTGVKKTCKSHSDCYGMREPDEWCLPSLVAEQSYM